jgi:hypothetical protein
MSNKQALLIGINYKGTSAQLNGCINDCDNLHEMLVKDLGFLPENITQLKEVSGYDYPTKANILRELNDLVIFTKNNGVDRVFISYSGHGSYAKDKNGDEKDKKDELLIPLDYTTKGVISDDQLNAIFKKFSSNVQVFGIFDCCHSASVLDLRYRYIGTKQNYRENSSATNLASNIVTLSGCLDQQVSADAYNINNSGEWSGALTTSFINVAKSLNYNTTIYNLLSKVRQFIKSRRYTQIPQICCTDALNYKSTVDLKSISFNYNIKVYQDEERRRQIAAQKRRRQQRLRRQRRQRSRRNRLNRRKRQQGRRRRRRRRQNRRQVPESNNRSLSLNNQQIIQLKREKYRRRQILIARRRQILIARRRLLQNQNKKQIQKKKSSCGCSGRRR